MYVNVPIPQKAYIESSKKNQVARVDALQQFLDILAPINPEKVLIDLCKRYDLYVLKDSQLMSEQVFKFIKKHNVLTTATSRKALNSLFNSVFGFKPLPPESEIHASAIAWEMESFSEESIRAATRF